MPLANAQDGGGCVSKWWWSSVHRYPAPLPPPRNNNLYMKQKLTSSPLSQSALLSIHVYLPCPHKRDSCQTIFSHEHFPQSIHLYLSVHRIQTPYSFISAVFFKLSFQHNHILNGPFEERATNKLKETREKPGWARTNSLRIQPQWLSCSRRIIEETTRLGNRQLNRLAGSSTVLSDVTAAGDVPTADDYSSWRILGHRQIWPGQSLQADNRWKSADELLICG